MHPPRLACEPLGRPLVAVAQVADHGFEQLRADLADAAQLLDGGERDHALSGQLLRLLGELEQLTSRGDALLGPAERLRGAVLGQPAVEHRLDGDRLLTGATRYLNPAVLPARQSACQYGPVRARAARRGRARRARRR